MAPSDVGADILNDVRSDGQEILAEHGRGTPIDRAARPEEIAEVVALPAAEAPATWSVPS